MQNELVMRLREEATRLSGRSIDKGCVDSGIAANLAEEAAQALEASASDQGVDAWREGIADFALEHADITKKTAYEYADEVIRAVLTTPPADTAAVGEDLTGHKWLDPECGVRGCQSLVWKDLYEKAVHGRAEFRQAYREARVATQAPVSGEPDFASDIARVVKEETEGGAVCGWKACSGCHETNDGYETGHYPHSKMFGCHVGSGCHECGGLGVVWEHWSEGSLAAMQAAASPVSEPQPSGAVCDVLTIKHSSGFPDYFSRVTVGNRSLTFYMSKIKGQCEYHTAEFNWLLNGGEKPDIMAFDYTEPEGLSAYLSALKPVEVDEAAVTSGWSADDARELLRMIDQVQGRPATKSIYGIYHPDSPFGLHVEKLRAALQAAIGGR